MDLYSISQTERRAMAANARQKRSYQGEFQHQLFMFRSVHDSDHGGVVRISVGQ